MVHPAGRGHETGAFYRHNVSCTAQPRGCTVEPRVVGDGYATAPETRRYAFVFFAWARTESLVVLLPSPSLTPLSSAPPPPPMRWLLLLENEPVVDRSYPPKDQKRKGVPPLSRWYFMDCVKFFSRISHRGLGCIRDRTS